MSRGRWTQTWAYVGRWRAQSTLRDVFDTLVRFLDAGLSLEEALGAAKEAAANRQAREYLSAAVASIERGAPLSSVWAARMPPLLGAMLAAAESTGQLAVALRHWVATVDEQRNWTQALTRMLGYPLVIGVCAATLVVFLLTEVLPSFASMYAGLGLHSPPALNLALRACWITLACCAAVPPGTGVVAAALLAVRRFHPRLWAKLRPFVPGAAWLRLYRTRLLCLSMSLLLRAGIPVVQALGMLQDMRHPTWLRTGCAKAERRLLEGARISEAFADDWDPALAQAIVVAERTGELGEMLARMERVCWIRTQSAVRAALRWVQPALIMVMGSLVAWCMSLLYIPMYDGMSQVMSQGGW